MVRKLRTSYLLPAELAEVARNYIKSVEEAGITDPLILRLIALLKADLEAIDASLTAVRSNLLVEQVSAADAVVDDLFVAFRDMVEIGKRRRDEAMLAAYQRVWLVLEKAGLRLYRLGYAEKAGRLSALISELDGAEFQVDIATLKATELYGDLKSAESEFDKLYNDRLEADNKMNYPTLAEAKKNIVPHINIFLGVISVLEETPGDADPVTVENLITKFNSITAEIMTTSKARKTRSENRNADEEEADSDRSSQDEAR